MSLKYHAQKIGSNHYVLPRTAGCARTRTRFFSEALFDAARRRRAGKRSWAHHNSAANYAVANRHIIVQGVQEALDEIFGAAAEVYYEISHNLVQEERLVLPDGSTKRGFVHRKGATRAFPAGHPDLEAPSGNTPAILA